MKSRAVMGFPSDQFQLFSTMVTVLLPLLNFSELYSDLAGSTADWAPSPS